MIEAVAKLNYLKMATRKVRALAHLIRGMQLKRAEVELARLPRRASFPVLKLLRQAAASAKNDLHLDTNELYVKKIVVDGGPTLKRYRARAFGRASRIRKRTSHITLVLGTKEVKSSK